jgi:ABC-type glycerol-3-phosphate transport system permease component
MMLSPFALVGKAAIQPPHELAKYPPILIPREPTLHNFTRVVLTGNFLRFIQNTTILGIGTIALTVPIAALAAFALSRFSFRGGRVFSQGVLLLYMFPRMLLLIPLYLLFFRWKLLDSLLGLMFAYTTFALPFAIWSLEGFFRAIPKELDEAAMVDGCTRMGTLFRIVLPLSTNGLAATAVYVFMQVWGEYVFAITFINTENKRTIVSGLNVMVTQFGMDYGLVMAAVLLTMVVPLVLFFMVQRYLIEALMAGALKG